MAIATGRPVSCPERRALHRGMPASLLALAMWFIPYMFVSTPALACSGPGSHQTMFFDDFTGIDEPIIAQVTITRMVDNPSRPRIHSIGIARLDRVVKGSIDLKEIKIFSPLTSCSDPLKVGSSGMVAGTLRLDTQGAVELHLKSESFNERHKRLQSKK